MTASALPVKSAGTRLKPTLTFLMSSSERSLLLADRLEDRVVEGQSCAPIVAPLKSSGDCTFESAVDMTEFQRLGMSAEPTAMTGRSCSEAKNMLAS